MSSLRPVTKVGQPPHAQAFEVSGAGDPRVAGQGWDPTFRFKDGLPLCWA